MGRNQCFDPDWNIPNPDNGALRHVHLYTGVTDVDGIETPHSHSVAGVTSQSIPCGGTHVHRLESNTDFFENHFHIIRNTTGPAVPVGGGRHVHEVRGVTSFVDGHDHKYIFATQIENPQGSF